MPNWTRNLLIVSNEVKMNELVKSHCILDKETNTYEMDFNTIKKMPEDLNIECGSRTRDGLRLLFTKLNPEVNYYGNKEEKLSYVNYLKLQEEMSKHCFSDDLKTLSQEEINTLISKYKENINKVEGLGKKSLNNAKLYNAMNWYEWSIKNWGTKWNATNTIIENSEMTFDTAWDSPISAILEMSRLHPEMPMALLFADEQIGVKTGYALLQRGKIDDSGMFRNFSIDAYKLAFRVWKNENEFHFDQNKNIYIRNDYLK